MRLLETGLRRNLVTKGNTVVKSAYAQVESAAGRVRSRDRRGQRLALRALAGCEHPLSLDRRGQIWLTDFGLAKLRERDILLIIGPPDAYEQLIDRLLASPRYGERWGRHWLDVARYADSHGYQDDGMRQMWPWR